MGGGGWGGEGGVTNGHVLTWGIKVKALARTRKAHGICVTAIGPDHPKTMLDSLDESRSEALSPGPRRRLRAFACMGGERFYVFKSGARACVRVCVRPCASDGMGAGGRAGFV